MKESKPYKWNLFRDGDPQKRVTTDRWGNEVEVIGKATRHKFTVRLGRLTHFGGETIVKRKRDGAVIGLHPKSVK